MLAGSAGCWVPVSWPPAQQAGAYGRLHGPFASPSHSGRRVLRAWRDCGGVQVAVDPQPASIAGEVALGQADVGEDASETAVADHPGQVEALDDDDVVLGGEGGGELVERVAAQVGRSRMDPGEPATSVVATPGSWPAAMQLSVESPQLAQRAFKGARVRDDGSGGEHGQVPDADVHADHGVLAIARWEPRLNFAGEGDVPTVGGLGDRGGHDARSAVFDTAGELLVDSCVLSTPIRGSWTCFRSPSTRMAPVVNRQALCERALVHRGNLIGRPFRRPFCESVQFLSARESP